MINPDFYTGAVIRLATLQKQKGQAGRLLFATVSLLPCGRPLPAPMTELDQCPIGKSGETVFFRRTLLTVQDAVKWYRSLGGGDDKSPVPSQADERDSKYDGIKLGVSSLIDDPTWPYLGLPIGEGFFSHALGHSNPAPFTGSVPARIHRRFGSQDGFEHMLANEKAVAFVARRLHVDLRLYREYLGSIALVAPDPILKQIDCYMIPASVEGGERIFYRFVPRAGASLVGLRLTTLDEQNYLLTDFSTHDIPANGILDVDKGDCIGMYGYVVSHPEHGVLAYSPPSPFVRQMGFNMHIMAEQESAVDVSMGESNDSPRMKYEVSPSSSTTTERSIGNPPRIPNANVRVAKAASYREKLANAKQYGQRWFANGSREEAMRFIQGELRRAKFRVIIADPYLSGLQLGQFLYAVNPQTTTVTLLTSTSAFSSKVERLSKIENFSKRLAQLKKEAKVTAKTYVLKRSMLHDRFLVTDDAVWFLGNSLNTLGEKASLIVKLPNPDEVIEHLEILREKSMPFENYVEECQVKSQENAVS